MAIPREPVVELQRRFERYGTVVLDRLREARAGNGQIDFSDLHQWVAAGGAGRIASPDGRVVGASRRLRIGKAPRNGAFPSG